MARFIVAVDVEDVLTSTQLASPSKGPEKCIQYLVEQGYEVYLMYSSDYKNFPKIYDWVRANFQSIQSRNIIYTQCVNRFYCDVLISANTTRLIDNKLCNRVCIDNESNRDIHDSAYDIIRCNNWNTVIDVVDKIYCKLDVI